MGELGVLEAFFGLSSYISILVDSFLCVEAYGFTVVESFIFSRKPLLVNLYFSIVSSGHG